MVPASSRPSFVAESRPMRDFVGMRKMPKAGLRQKRRAVLDRGLLARLERGLLTGEEKTVTALGVGLGGGAWGTLARSSFSNRRPLK